MTSIIVVGCSEWSMILETYMKDVEEKIVDPNTLNEYIELVTIDEETDKFEKIIRENTCSEPVSIVIVEGEFGDSYIIVSCRTGKTYLLKPKR